MNKCERPSYKCKMYKCAAGVDFEEQKACDYFDKASRIKRCMYQMKMDDFIHCGCCRAQIDADKV